MSTTYLRREKRTRWYSRDVRVRGFFEEYERSYNRDIAAPFGRARPSVTQSNDRARASRPSRKRDRSKPTSRGIFVARERDRRLRRNVDDRRNARPAATDGVISNDGEFNSPGRGYRDRVAFS